MPFDPLDWLRTAESLALSIDDEAALRASATRYYYAVWLKSLLALEANGLYTRRNGREDHQGVVRALKLNRRHQVGDELQNLARLRERADYDEATRFTAEDAGRARTLAERARFLSAPDWS